MFSKAIVRTPCKNLVNGLTSANLGKPDYEKALIQHQDYIRALQKCCLDVTILEPDENYPDSTFVEDAALLTPHCAIITNPGAPSRKGEITNIKNELERHYSKIEYINNPGTLEAGDVMMVGDHYYIGISERTNTDGAWQLINILESCGMSGSTVLLKGVLHLKTAVSYIGNNILLAAGEFIDNVEFKNFNIIKINDEETYAANSVWINDYVLVPIGFTKTSKAIESAGYKVIEVDVPEFQKLDGGLSCLSLRF